MESQPAVPGRDPVDLTDRLQLAGPAGRISQAVNLLAAAETVGRTRSLAGHLAGVPGDAGCAQTAQLARSLDNVSERGVI